MRFWCKILKCIISCMISFLWKCMFAWNKPRLTPNCYNPKITTSPRLRSLLVSQLCGSSQSAYYDASSNIKRSYGWRFEMLCWCWRNFWFQSGLQPGITTIIKVAAGEKGWRWLGTALKWIETTRLQAPIYFWDCTYERNRIQAIKYFTTTNA